MMGNITRVIPVDLITRTPANKFNAQGDFVDENGFFIRAGIEGVLKYCPMGNLDSEFIIKDFAASQIFIDPEICRKIFHIGTVSPAQAHDIYVGYGV